jgi:hypothetical protein
VTYVFYDCEEVAADRNGLLRLSRRAPGLLAGDFAVLLEPSGGNRRRLPGHAAGRGHRAGKRAHTARSWMGRNAIHEAGPILDVLRAYTPREPEVDGLRYHEGLNAVAIRGGVAGNVVPDECVVTVNYRFAPDRDGQQAADFVRSLFSAWPVTVLDVARAPGPAWAIRPAAFVAAVGGTPRAKLGWTDVARFAALGIPAVNYGPGISEIAHTADEYVQSRRSPTAKTGCAPGWPYRAGPLAELIEVVCRGPVGALPADRDDAPRVVLGGNAGQRAGRGDGLAVDRDDHVTGRFRPWVCAGVPHSTPRISAPVAAGAILAGTPAHWLVRWQAAWPAPGVAPPPPDCSSSEACCRGFALLLRDLHAEETGQPDVHRGAGLVARDLPGRSTARVLMGMAKPSVPPDCPDSASRCSRR